MYNLIMIWFYMPSSILLSLFHYLIWTIFSNFVNIQDVPLSFRLGWEFIKENKKKQENKTSTKNAIKKKRMKTRSQPRKRPRKKTLFFLDRFLGRFLRRFLVFFYKFPLLILISCNISFERIILDIQYAKKQRVLFFPILLMHAWEIKFVTLKLK